MAYSDRRWCAETAGLMPRMEQAAVHLAQLGPRCTLELLVELGCEFGILPEVADRLADYARLTPELVCATGADRMPDRRPLLVASQ